VGLLSKGRITFNPPMKKERSATAKLLKKGVFLPALGKTVPAPQRKKKRTSCPPLMTVERRRRKGKRDLLAWESQLFLRVCKKKEKKKGKKGGPRLRESESIPKKRKKRGEKKTALSASLSIAKKQRA